MFYFTNYWPVNIYLQEVGYIRITISLSFCRNNMRLRNLLPFIPSWCNNINQSGSPIPICGWPPICNLKKHLKDNWMMQLPSLVTLSKILQCTRWWDNSICIPCFTRQLNKKLGFVNVIGHLRMVYVTYSFVAFE